MLLVMRNFEYFEVILRIKIKLFCKYYSFFLDGIFGCIYCFSWSMMFLEWECIVDFLVYGY